MASKSETSDAAGDAPRVFSIPPGAPFLPTLARALVDGELIEGYRPRDDPFTLPDATIYLPTRRAARALAAEFVAVLGGRAALLPAILTLGDDPDDLVGFEQQAAGDGPEMHVFPAAERRLLLARLVRGWTDRIAQGTRDLFGDEDIVLPSSAPEALRMAGELARLLDQFETEEVPLSALAGLQPSMDEPGDGGTWAQWWNLTLAFLAIISDNWPGLLAEAGKTDPGRARRLALDARAERYRASGSHGPVIVAGTTGSIPATARLASAVARLPQGAVVLPGLDSRLSPERLARFAADGDADAAIHDATHAQYALARLLAVMKADPMSIRPLGPIEQQGTAREAAISVALLPAEDTARWRELEAGPPEATRGLSLIEAPGEREEALAIAIALREAIEAPGAVAALTTPDRKLARRVAAELHRFGIEIDDSAGVPLHLSAAGLFVRQLVAVALGPADAAMLAAFVKQPILAGALAPGRADMPRLFELAVLRGAIVVPKPGEFGEAVEKARQRVAEDRHAPAVLSALEEADWAEMSALAERLDGFLTPLSDLADEAGAQPLAGCCGQLMECLASILGEDGEPLADWPGGAQALELLRGHAQITHPSFPVEPTEFGDALDALLAAETVRNAGRSHPRLHVWGPLEARLQHVDVMVLGGLNEGTWPVQGRNDAFLNRPMRAELGLSLPERRIGQAAHDFQQLSGHGRVIYSRSVRVDNAPTVASRWLQRLGATAGDEAWKAMKQRGDRWLRLAQAIDRTDVPPQRPARPAPRPPVELRPKKLSVTEIETWIRDPYAIHARHVLGLQPLPPLEREADALLKGRIYHEIAEKFVAATHDRAAEPEALERVAQAVFAAEQLPPQVAALWLPRFLAIGRLFATWEADRRDDIVRSILEAGGRLEVGDSGFVLSGRADRIDLRRDGRIDIIDYKTGASPSKKQARTLSPQLALEAKMAQLGAFGEPAQGEPGRLLYVRLRPGDTLQVDDICEGRDAPDAHELVESAWQSLQALIAAFEHEEQGYVSRRAPVAERLWDGPYDHLARVREWSIGEMEDDGAAGGGD